MIRVTPLLIPSVYQAVGPVAEDRDHVPKYIPTYDVVKIVPHNLDHERAPFDTYVQVNTGCTRSVVSSDWAAKCGWLKAQGPYRFKDYTSPWQKELLECTGIVTFNVR